MTALVTIVADDLTGGCDSGALFAGGERVPLAIWPRSLPRASVGVVDTESRAINGPEAAARVRDAAGRAPAAHLFKKIDSTLRGRIGAETEAMMEISGISTALLCPAFPAQGRIVADRVLRVHGTPVTATAIAADPNFPQRPTAGRDLPDLADLLASQVARPLAWMLLDEVREGPGLAARRLGALEGSIVLAESETDADLDTLAAAALASNPPPLLVGSAGLAGAVARRLGRHAGPVALPPAARWLIVAGSRHPVTRRQAAAARAHGLDVLTTEDMDAGDRRAVARALAARARAALERDGADLVLATGGETAVALAEMLGAEHIDLVGVPRPGLALGHLRIPGRPALPLLTKAGAFGEDDLFVSLARETGA